MSPLIPAGGVEFPDGTQIRYAPTKLRLSFAPRPSQPLASAPQPVMIDRRSGRRSASRRQEACLHLSPRHSQPCEPPRSPHFFFFCAENLKLDRLDQTCSHPSALQTEQHSRVVLRISLHRSHRTRKQARPESVQPTPPDHDQRKHISAVSLSRTSQCRLMGKPSTLVRFTCIHLSSQDPQE